MKIWVVYFRGEPEYATLDYSDAAHRASQLRNGYCEENVEIREEEQK